MVKKVEKIIQVNVKISKELWDEINAAKNSLNLKSKLNSIGKKKEKYSFVEASHKIGKMLKQMRRKALEQENIYKL